MNWRSTILSLLAVWMVLSCKNEVVPPLAVLNQLKVDDAILPVHIYGNQQSRTAAIVIHGGPGESAILKREATGFTQLEEQYQVVYYDQRGAGISEGNIDESNLSIEQMSRDLHTVIEVIESGTEVNSIYLISLDWGGAIAVEYLVSALKSPMVKGYVAVSPGFNAPKNMEQSRLDVIEIAEDFLEDGSAVNDGPAQNILAFYENNPVINRFNYEENYRILESLLGIIFNVNYVVSGVEPPAYIQSLADHNMILSLNNMTYRDIHFLDGLNVEDKLSAIDVPVKIIWGEWDRLMPVGFAGEYQDLLGPASEDELLSIFPFSANRPYLEEGDRFFATVATWMTFHD